ncbi:MAG: integrase/recombinase XerD, partial [Clostridium sp.]
MPAELQRTAPKKKAKELAKYLRKERPDYNYLKSLFKYLREELEIEVPRNARKLPYVPTEDEIKNYYKVVWNSKNFQDMLIIKVLIYTGVRVSELDLLNCQIRINQGKGNKDRVVPFPDGFKEVLGIHCNNILKNNATYLFESSWKKKY